VQDKQFYSPAEVAHELGISSTTVLRLVHDGRLPALRVSERIYRIPAASFERYKAGTVEEPFMAALGPLKPRPRFGSDERQAEAASDNETRRAPAGARGR
jgi:excisionase family DNA binding protein